ncbi:hypothetical protein K437DRAFT_102664 [Tilletiaria anomala UBC 951]|uniref:Uncharacterized protein n=1 Tax=Tilletiaria anomala (strain ATCC 24038 / CBS 436.72 / UBC 951) TaxID=1037660 RepID=A0A066W7C2_TILAU|nr:uncharacterized protein K437DRAFT_102664 [Tilletiaria anomala UBC 951]KDN46984.1 hypothetical protein K437DRAFT_102664 [Tilletiaria anomala UBC 951]
MDEMQVWRPCLNIRCGLTAWIALPRQLAERKQPHTDSQLRDYKQTNRYAGEGSMTDPSQTLSIGSVPALATDSPALAQDVGAGTAGQDQAPSGGAATPAVQLPLESSAAAKDATHGHSLPNNASDSSFNIQGSPASPQLSFDELGRPLQLQRGAEAGYTPAPTLTSEYKARGSSSMMGLGISSLFASTSNPVAAVMPPGASLPTPVLFPLRGDSVSMPSPSVSRGTFPSPPTLPKPAKLPEEAASPPLTTSTKSGFRARLFSRSKASFSATPPSLAPTGDSVPSLPLSPPPAGPATSMGTEGGASGKGRQGTEQFENDLVSSMTLPPGSATAGKVGGVESLEEVGEAGESIKGATAAGAEPGTTDRLRRDIGQLESDLGSSMAPPIAQRQGARVRPQPIDTSVQMKEGIISATGSSSSMEAPTPRSRDTASPPVSTSAAGAGSSFLGSGFARGMFDGLRRGGSASKKEGQLGSNVGSKGKSREPDSPLSASVLGAPLAVFGPDERLPRSREDSGPHEMGRSYSTAYAPPPHAVNVRLGLLASADNIITPPSVSSPRLGPRLHQSQSQDQFRPPPHLRSASVGGVSSNAHDIISKTSSAPASAASAPGPASHSAFVKVATYPANRSFPNSGSVLPDSASNDSAPTAPGTYSAAAGRADEARYMLMSAPKSLSFFGIQPKNAAASAPVGEKAAAAAACAAATATAIAARKKDAAGPGWHQDEIGDGDEGGNVASSLPSGASEAIISRHQSVSGMSDGTMVTASTGPHSRTESFSGPSIAGDMREGQFSLHALAPGSKTPMQESSSGSVASPSSSEGLRFATPSKWPTASSTTFQRPSLKTRDSEISLPELTKVGSYSDSGHESAFSASPPEVPMLRRLGATRRTSFLPPAAELTHSSSAGCGNTPIGSAGSFGAGLSGSAAPSPASQPESAPGTRTGGGHKWHSRMLSASQLSKLNPGTRILADLEATQPVAPRALVPAGKSRRVIVRRASWPFESKEAAKSKAKKGARHRELLHYFFRWGPA